MATHFQQYGQVTIEFDGTASGFDEAVIINKTDFNQDTIFSVATSDFVVTTDQLAGAYFGNHYIETEGTTFTCSAIIEAKELANLNAAYELVNDTLLYNPHGKYIKFGTLRIHPVSEGTDTSKDIVGFKTYCRVEVVGNMKANDYVSINLTFIFSADDDENSDTYGMIYSIGDFISPLK